MKVTVFGSNGRVGSEVVRICQSRGHITQCIDVDTTLDENFCPDVVIDFSLPQTTVEVVNYCTQHLCPLVSGVTGQNTKQQADLDNLSRLVTVVHRSNFSEGIAIVTEICTSIARQKPSWDCDIVETHRQAKIDSPSGTAKKIAAELAAAKGPFGKVTIHSLRSGTNLGTHEIVFGGIGESVTITHHVDNVQVFAIGAVNVAEQIVTKNSKIYSSEN